MDEKLERLTPEQDFLLAECLNKFRDLELSTEPAQKDLAEHSMRAAYEACGFQAPEIHWCGSPLGIFLSRAIVACLAGKPGGDQGETVDGPNYFVDFNDTTIGANLSYQMRDRPITAAESETRNACAPYLWYSISSLDTLQKRLLQGAPAAGAFLSDVPPRGSQSTNSAIVPPIGQAIRAIAQMERRDDIPSSVWEGALECAERVLGFSIESKRSYNELSKYRWPYFFGAMDGFPHDCGYGQHDARALAVPSFFTSIELVADSKELAALLGLTENAGWYLPHTRVCWLSERQTHVSLDDRGRIHCEDGPAISYPDGWNIFAWHGVLVNEKTILRPTELTAAEIDQEPNQEVRRVMVERLGEENYFLSGELVTIDDDPKFGTLLRKSWSHDDEPLQMVRVLNSTTEPDGTRKTYLLRVPANLRSARQAVAWTFGLEEDEYMPDKET